ncbi:TSUP family transporter [Cocleimonas sp. KMM 6892]|uniref:TSUP family transporter n=1 Tax=unclassified Cocleimonas TaxID=2639732 RepID=UPI002DBCA8F9|nr:MULTISPECIES: TSUP family transporter [unclassified Cocleimonas]MEB8432229.1 TSUP family transporter [Cocleimonas sp. KMM 6892]MEC4714685.1 TSUP family transporter [Cocleimonas sp. KMM 6895]MEC4744501.1 TSUP family transporter [Cocleimonas sp. KMM 6896]
MDILNTFLNNDLSAFQFMAIAAIFIWTGFVRTGIGFGGAALGLPLLLLVDDQPLVFLPIIGTHLLLFTSFTIVSRIQNVNWPVVAKSMSIIIVPKILGLIGLLSLPNYWLIIIVFSITLFYGATWLLNYTIRSQSKAVDVALLTLGGYISGTSLTGAPLIVAVVARYVNKIQLRETLFVIWIILVAFKMTAFVVYDVELQWQFSLVLIPFVAIGHYIGLRVHDYFINTDSNMFHRVLGASLIVISGIGLIKHIF